MNVLVETRRWRRKKKLSACDKIAVLDLKKEKISSQNEVKYFFYDCRNDYNYMQETIS